MKIRPAFAAVALGLALSGCSNQYFERKDTATFNAGDAVAWNLAQQNPDPWPKPAYNTNIVSDGDKQTRAVQRYIDGRYRWYNDQSDQLTDTTIKDPSGAAAGGGGGGPH